MREKSQFSQVTNYKSLSFMCSYKVAMPDPHAPLDTDKVVRLRDAH